MPVAYRQTKPEVALWDDVVQVMGGKPYRLHRLASIGKDDIARSKRRGYFGEKLSRRIQAATNNRLKLTPYDARPHKP